MIQNEDELKLFAPLGCGFQTGMGTVDHFAGTGQSDTVVILGLGGVGLAAIAASRRNTPSLRSKLLTQKY
jgi:Zn-dependent alcohol dehydrogenase